MRLLDKRFTDTTATCPIVAIDIDGVLNFEGRVGEAGVTYRNYRFGPGGQYLVRVRTDVLEVLAPLLDAEAEGRITLAWGTMWEENAAREFAPRALQGYGEDWPVIHFNTFDVATTFAERQAYQAEHKATRFEDYCFKTPAIAEFSYQVMRPVIWLDDMVGFADREYLRRFAFDATAITVPVETGLNHDIVAYVMSLLPVPATA